MAHSSWLLARDVQRRGAIIRSLRDGSADSEEQPGALEVVVLARDEQRCGAVVRGLVDRCAGLEEQPDALVLPHLARDVQRRGAALRGLVDRHTPASRSSLAHSTWPSWDATKSGVAPPCVA